MHSWREGVKFEGAWGKRLPLTQEESQKEKLAGMFSSWNKHITLIAASILQV